MLKYLSLEGEFFLSGFCLNVIFIIYYLNNIVLVNKG